ncbi:hypothetical protein [Bradyrhizobium japonicum]|uniref:hypothetical protein n=1 Tax=Bradyrhizobium japonicum TaxID=375 RepID=UPI00200E84CC|nr:hypothetical protein [Bradyrhizobium japonicum]
MTDEVTPLVVLLPLSIANGLIGAFCEDPVFWVDEDDFEFVSDWIASSALDTAPRANNIAQLQPMRHAAANVLAVMSASVVPAQKAPKSSMKSAFATPGAAREHRQFMPVAAEISAHRKHATPALPG